MEHRLDTNAGLTFLGVSTPTFVSGLVVPELLRRSRLGWFRWAGTGADAWGRLEHAFLPALTLALLGASTYASGNDAAASSSMAARTATVRTALGQGPSYPRVVVVHMGSNALLPVVTMLGLSLRILVSGAIITEADIRVARDGTSGRSSHQWARLPVVLGIIFVTCVFVQLGNVLADGCVAIFDPRARTEL